MCSIIQPVMLVFYLVLNSARVIPFAYPLLFFLVLLFDFRVHPKQNIRIKSTIPLRYPMFHYRPKEKKLYPDIVI